MQTKQASYRNNSQTWIYTDIGGTLGKCRFLGPTPELMESRISGTEDAMSVALVTQLPDWPQIPHLQRWGPW